MPTALEQLVEIARNKRESPDYGNKHGNDAKYGLFAIEEHRGRTGFDIRYT
jgi:hypothetical protein